MKNFTFLALATTTVVLMVVIKHMEIKKDQPYGSWQSPITADNVAQDVIAFKEAYLANGIIYWLESRPLENGRTVLMSFDKEKGTHELLPKDYGVRSGVHGYGGGALLIVKIDRENQIYFVRDSDQQIYLLDNKHEIRKITSYPQARFADGCIHPDKKSLFYVMEEHINNKVLNSIVKTDIATGSVDKIADGNDFYAQPRINPNGSKLVYTTWNHPNMSWDGCELWEIDLATGAKKLLGGNEQSVVDPQWSADGKLHFVSDKTGWWNIYRNADEKPLLGQEAEYALPGFFFGRSLYGFSGDSIVASNIIKGVHYFVRILGNGSIEKIDLPFTSVRTLSVEDNHMVLIAGSPHQPMGIMLVNLQDQSHRVIASSCKLSLDPQLISEPQLLEFSTSDNQQAYAFYYAPKNPKYQGISGEKPPLLVRAHGGPTAQFPLCLSLDIAYWTSRGFALVDVNYRGSTGYGRAYRNSLREKWGLYDVDDCVNAANYCVEQGLADKNRLAIEGGSAGGFTTLAALATRNVFQVGANYYGVSNLEKLVLETHKFQSHYLFGLIGKYPNARHVYLERSPLFQVDAIKKPVIIFQGEKDTIVPPSQSDVIYHSLVERGIPTAYILYKDEGHVFSKAPNIKNALEAQRYFFSTILKIPIQENIPHIDITNFDKMAQ